MVQRYIEIPEAEVATCMHEDFDGDYVKYEDYAALHALLCRLTDQVNLCELPDGLYDDLEKAGAL